jgi:hypothetical protein
VIGQLHALADLPQGKEPNGTHWVGGWVGSSVGLNDMENWPYQNSASDPSVVQPLASGSGDYALITVHKKINIINNIANKE